MKTIVKFLVIVNVFLMTVDRSDGKRTIFKLEISDEEREDGNADFHLQMDHPSTGTSMKGFLKQNSVSDFDVFLSGSSYIFGGMKSDFSINGITALTGLEAGYHVNCSLKGIINSTPFTYLLDFSRLFICPHFTLHHQLTTENETPLSFVSSLKQENCRDNDGNFSHLVIDIDLDSHTNPLIQETRLKQLFVFEDDSGWESMNFTNPVMDIRVTAEWKDLNDDKAFSSRKRAVFQSNKLLDWIPSFDIQYIRNQEQIMLNLIRGLRKQTHHDSKDEL